MKTILRTVCGAILVWLVLGATHAGAQTQSEMNRQAAQEFEEADAELNKAYKKFIVGMEAADLEELKTAQRLWVQFRDAQANFEADQEARGGSMRPLSYYGCCTRLTRARTAEFR